MKRNFHLGLKYIKMRTIVLILVILTLLGCNSNSNSNKIRMIQSPSDICHDTIFVNLEEDTDLFISQFDIGNIIPLATDNNFILGDVSRIDFLDSMLFILDKTTESIFSFSMEGSGLSKLDKKGKGPKEYLFLKNFFLDKQRKEICIPDIPRKSILKYDLDGNFINRVNFKNYIGSNITVTKGGNYCSFSVDGAINSNPAKLSVFDAKANIISEFLKQRYYLGDVIIENLQNPVCLINDTSFFIRFVDQHIYSYNDSAGFSKEYFIDFGKNKYRREEIEKIDIGIDPFFEHGLPRSIYNLFFTKKYIYFMAIFGNKVHEFYYNRHTKKTTSTKGLKIDRFDRVIPFNVVGTVGDWFIFSIQAQTFKEQVGFLRNYAKGNISKDMEKLISINKGIDINDNPILIFYKPQF